MTRVTSVHFVCKVAVYILLLQLTGDWQLDNIATVMKRRRKIWCYTTSRHWLERKLTCREFGLVNSVIQTI
jgi:hypothetical protein